MDRAIAGFCETPVVETASRIKLSPGKEKGEETFMPKVCGGGGGIDSARK